MDPEFPRVFREHLTSLNKETVTIIEVGTWKGLSAITMANIARECNVNVQIICIDTWLGAPEFWTWGLHDHSRGVSLKRKNGYPQVYFTFLKNVVDNGHTGTIVPFPISSNEAAEVLKYHGIKADIIYVDGSHEYEAVKNDMGRFWELLNDGGVMFGDDYMNNWPGVVQAVNEFPQDHVVSGVVWSIKKKLAV
jgi:predicted O-methyltransferase YrrM